MNEMDKKFFADVIPGISHKGIDRPFQYIVPERLRGALSIGAVVNIPFGRGNKLIKGYVTAFSEVPLIDKDRLKEIDSISADLNRPETGLIKLAGWMRDRYKTTMRRALKTVLPVSDNVRPNLLKKIFLKLPKDSLDKYIEGLPANAAGQRRLLSAFKEIGEGDFISEGDIKQKYQLSPSVISALEKKGIIEVKNEIVYRDPIGDEIRGSLKTEVLPDLNSEQAEACAAVQAALREGKSENFLLYGVTGSGKTRVYIELIREVLSQGKQAVVLIPEIALTFQTVSRFYSEFGRDVSVINSKMSKGEKYDQFLRALNGDVKIMIGPRSALFTPFSKLGLIIIDEEQEEAYKSDKAPRYDAREVALFMAKNAGACVVMGSATPSVDTFYKAKNGEYKLLTLTKRAKAKSLARVYSADMRSEFKQGNKTMFSRALIYGINESLKAGEQSILFLNKRGFAGFVSCRSCGYVFKCSHCDISMTYHKTGDLVCHYCGDRIKMPERCPECKSVHIAGMRAGTQQVEDRIKEVFPAAKVIRMDKDTTGRKGAHERLLNTFAKREADILVGTQMIVKGHDYENVTFVGAIAADMSLHANNYKASERTFQLLCQAAGRAGRGERSGNVVIQTYDPDNYAISYAVKQDYEGFYNEEIRFRELAMYPPVYGMITFEFSSDDEEELASCMNILDAYIKESYKDFKNVFFIGPSKGTVYKMEDRYYENLYIKSAGRELLDEIVKNLYVFFKEKGLSDKIYIQFDRE